MLQIAEDDQKIRISCIYTGKYTLEATLRIALQMPPGAVKGTLDAKMNISNDKNRDRAFQQECRAFGEEPGYHKSLIVLFVGI